MKGMTAMIDIINEAGFAVAHKDGARGMLSLPDKSIKLVYGSPPYPNADRDYGTWKSAEYIDKIRPFIDAAIPKLTDDGFIVINVKANREKATSSASSRRSLVVEKLAIMLEEEWGLNCVDIEIWVKENPAPTGLRVACQDAYEQNLWFSISPKWEINIDAIRRSYESHSVKTYEGYEYKPRTNGNTYVRKNKKIQPNPLGALPKNIISGPVSARIGDHQATQPFYLPEKYIKATTEEGDLVVDPWLGSGTTGYVAVKLGRRFAGFDVVDTYVKEARKWISEARQEVLADV
jgi:DNA modification methylase